MYLAYSALLALGLLLSLPYWVFQTLRHGKYRAGLRERLGRVPERLCRDKRPAIWIHAVSVGEVLAVGELVGELRRRFPGNRLVVSTTTDTGQRLARTRFGEENVCYFPLDFGFAIRPYLKTLQPELVLLAETEFWPNFLRLSRQSGAGVAVVNARISDRSLPGYRRFHGLLARVLQNVNLFLAQTDEDRNRLMEIGAPSERMRVTGNLKFDAPLPAPPPIVASLQAELQRSGAGPIIVCGSTVRDEEPLLLHAFRNVLASHPQAVMILAPRHPERFGEVAHLMETFGTHFWRRSLWSGEPVAGGVLLLDSIGELASVYSLADVAFVGGSLVPLGGHNIIEPARHGIAIVVGNHTENFRDMIELFKKHDAVRVAGPAEFPLVLMELISNEAERIALGRRAAETMHAQAGATRKTADALEELLRTRGSGSEHRGSVSSDENAPAVSQP